MKIVAGYLLLVLGGNATPSATDLKSLLSSVGAEAADEMIDLFLSNVSGKDITELIASGREKLASVPSGGGGGVALTAAAAAGAAASYDAAPADAPAEAKKEEIAEEEDDDLGFSLFDD